VMASEHYLDHAAGTPPFEQAAAVAAELTMAFPGNPSGLHRRARAAASLLEEARERISAECKASPSGVIFTSGGTEADNLAIKGIAFAKRDEGLDHIIVSSIEHHAVLDSAKWLSTQGFRVELAPVGPDGVVDVAKLANSLTESTGLVSIMTANNETGAIQPIPLIAEVVRERAPRAVIHSDACQAFSSRQIALGDLGVDALSLSAHKIGGTQGAGAVVLRDGVRIEKIAHGGGQELGRRGGTQNVAAIAAFGVAAQLAAARRADFLRQAAFLRDLLESQILDIYPEALINASTVERLPNILNVTLPGVLAEDILVLLDRKGVYASTGSACTSGTAQPSHVLLAMGLAPELARCTLRISFGHTSTLEDVKAAADALAEAASLLSGKEPPAMQKAPIPRAKVAR